MTVLLLALGCQTDPLRDPAFIPPTEDRVTVAITPPDRPYRVGEPIPLDLVFSTTAPRGRQPVDLTVPDARGRPAHDVWTVRPAGAVDPGVWWQDAGGRLATRSGTVGLDAPLIASVHLNDWVRFDRAGTFALQLHTSRVGSLDLSSNAFTIQIQPRDAAADEARVVQLTEALSRPEDRAAALRELAWIGSPSTVPLAVRQLVDPEAPDRRAWAVLLSAHPLRAEAARALDEALVDPELPVFPELIEARVAVDYGEHYAAVQPPQDGEQPSLGWQTAQQAREGRREHAREAALARVAGALDAKEPAARGVALGTLLGRLLAFGEPPPWRDTALRTLRAEIGALPEADAARALGEGWHLVADPAVAAPLAALIRAPSTSVALRDQALARLVALDAAAARPVIHELVADPARPVSAASQDILRSLPEVPESTRQRLVDGIGTAADPELHLALVSAYVGPDMLDVVQAAWESTRSPSTGVIAGYAAYFLRHDPPRARGPLAQWSQEHHDLLLRIGPMIPDPKVLLPRAFEALRSHPTRDVYLQASNYLREYALPDAVDPLRQLVGRTSERRRDAVIAALCCSRAWLLTRNGRLELEQLLPRDAIVSHAALSTALVSDYGHARVDATVNEGVPSITLNFLEYVGEEAVREKIDQFAPGTRLDFTFQGIDAQSGRAMFVKLLEGTEVMVPAPQKR